MTNRKLLEYLRTIKTDLQQMKQRGEYNDALYGLKADYEAILEYLEQMASAMDREATLILKRNGERVSVKLVKSELEAIGVRGGYYENEAT